MGKNAKIFDEQNIKTKILTNNLEECHTEPCWCVRQKREINNSDPVLLLPSPFRA